MTHRTGMRPTTLLFLALIVLLGGCGSDGVVAPTYGSITGRVVDALSGSAMAAARVTTMPATQAVLTDSTGRYSLVNVPAGTVSVFVERAAYRRDSAAVVVTGGQATTADFLLRLDTTNGGGGGGFNRPPLVPSAPSPADGSVDLPLRVEMRWTSGDPDGDPLSFDIWLRKEGGERVVAGTNMPSAAFVTGDLERGTRYEWGVTAKDGRGGVTAGPTWSFTTDAPAANALMFNGPLVPDGSDAAIFVDASEGLLFDQSQSYTIEAWIRPEGFDGPRWQWIVTKGSSYNMMFGIVDGRLFLQSGSTEMFVQSEPLVPGHWYHVAGVVDDVNDRIRVYVDGVSAASKSINGVRNPAPGPLLVGAFFGPNGVETGFNGIIHELRIWGRALSTEQIATGRSSRVPPAAPGLLLHYPLNEGIGNVVANRALGQPYDGVFAQGPRWVTAELPIP